MKASNLTTPRSLAECQFFPAADPIERPQPRKVSPVALWAACWLLVASVFLAVVAR